MVSSVFRECLLDVYLGEHAGEAAFEIMLASAADDDQRYVLGSLLQAETEGKAIMRPLISRLGLPMLDGDRTSSGAVDSARQLNALPWQERFAALAGVVRSNFLPRYEELATLVSAEEDAEAARIAQFMGDHERAVLALADNVAKGVADPAAPVAAILHFPLHRSA